jgi:hypothetical protein
MALPLMIANRIELYYSSQTNGKAGCKLGVRRRETTPIVKKLTIRDVVVLVVVLVKRRCFGFEPVNKIVACTRMDLRYSMDLFFSQITLRIALF